MHTDGDGWVECAQGHRHWGRFGAAGLLLRHIGEDGTPAVLLQHRAAWSHHGDTWGIPGGARDSHETPEQAALREAVEESGLDTNLVSVTGEWVDDHGLWAYTTVLAYSSIQLEVSAVTFESVAFRWVPEPEVGELPLHPGFAVTWPYLSGTGGPGDPRGQR